MLPSSCMVAQEMVLSSVFCFRRRLVSLSDRSLGCAPPPCARSLRRSAVWRSWSCRSAFGMRCFAQRVFFFQRLSGKRLSGHCSVRKCSFAEHRSSSGVAHTLQRAMPGSCYVGVGACRAAIHVARARRKGSQGPIFVLCHSQRLQGLACVVSKYGPIKNPRGAVSVTQTRCCGRPVGGLVGARMPSPHARFAYAQK